MSEIEHGCRRVRPGSTRFRIAARGALVTVVGVTVGLLSTSIPEADAHGSTQEPPSRVHSCRFTQPSNAMCQDAEATDPQAIYDWMEVNIGDAAGRHRELIPDGELCSAGRDKYAAFDVPGEWPLTHLTPNQAGEYEIVFENTAPHATAYYHVYLTDPGFDARTDRLGWDDLQLIHDSGAMEASSEAHFAVDLPDRDVPAILYVVWQRSDSPEAFYACSDVTISSDGTSAPVPPASDHEDHNDGDHSHGDASGDTGGDEGGDHGGHHVNAHETPPAAAVTGRPSLTG
jgi:predicted carbohydrate-binding protein with CBM5 and CBM33 domain